jgi:hypothetical protein
MHSSTLSSNLYGVSRFCDSQTRPVAVPGKIVFEKQFTKRPVDGNAPDFLVFGLLGRYRYKIVFQVDVDPYHLKETGTILYLRICAVLNFSFILSN